MGGGCARTPAELSPITGAAYVTDRLRLRRVLGVFVRRHLTTGMSAESAPQVGKRFHQAAERAGRCRIGAR